jgi:hypothetical protein
MLALAATFALVAAAATAGVRVIEADAEPSLKGPALLRAPAKRLQRAIEHFRRQQMRRLRSSRYVLGVPRSSLEAIAACESGGDPSSVSADGSYRGKYQFDYGTWASLGGRGDPAAAPEYEQDVRAAMLYRRAGSSPWPVCG